MKKGRSTQGGRKTSKTRREKEDDVPGGPHSVETAQRLKARGIILL